MYEEDYINHWKSHYGEMMLVVLFLYFAHTHTLFPFFITRKNTFEVNDARQIFTTNINRYYSYIIAKHSYTFKPLSFLFHTVPGHLLDFLALLTGKPRM